MNRHELFGLVFLATAYLSLASARPAFAWCFWEKDRIPEGVSTNPVHAASLALSDARRRQNQFLPKTLPDANDFRFAADGTFTFFHLSDFHRSRPEMTERERAFFVRACAKYRPALAVMTGDNANLRCRGLFESVATPLVRLFTEAKLPFAVTFGNHDTEAVGEGWYTAAEQWSFYAKAGGDLFVDRHDPSVPGGGVQAIDIRDATGAVRFRLAVVDSGDYGPKGFDSVRAPVVAWARQTLKAGFPTLFFQHIVVPETREPFGRGLFRAAKEDEKGVKEGCWNVPTVVNERRAVGEIKEGMGSVVLEECRNPIYLSEGDSIYDVWRKAPNFKGAYFGHDHVNSVDGTTTDGVRLGITKTSSECAYNDGKLALRVVRLHTDGTYETFLVTEGGRVRHVAVFGGSFSVIPPSKVAKAEWCRRANLAYHDYGVGGAGFVSQGPGGTNGVSVQVERALASGNDYDAFVFWASTNDIWKEGNLPRQNAGISNCVARIRAARPEAKVLFLTSLPIPLRKEAARLAEYAEGQAETCRRLGVPVLEQHRLVAFPSENAADYFGKDKLHPSEKGYGFVKDVQADFLLKALQPSL